MSSNKPEKRGQTKRYKKRMIDATNACEQAAKLWPGT